MKRIVSICLFFLAPFSLLVREVPGASPKNIFETYDALMVWCNTIKDIDTAQARTGDLLRVKQT